MASRLMQVISASICFITLACTAAPPIKFALDQSSRTVAQIVPISASNLQDAGLLNSSSSSITFNIPGTQTSLIFSRFSKLISQTELDLCIIEGIGSIFGKVLAKGGDAFLPLHAVEYQYGNVGINVYDFAAPTSRMTYALVVSTLRGIALFTSLYGYHGMTFEVYNDTTHVGTGDCGPFVPT